MALSDHDGKLVGRSVDAIKAGCGTRLQAVVLCGDAAGGGYRAGKSRLELAVVVDAVDDDTLHRLTRALPRTWRRRVAAPLLFDPLYIQSSLDVFPLEFLDLADRHELLFGEHDPFAELVFEREHLRLQIEQQLRGKLLHLWEAYLAARGSRRHTRRLLIDTPAAFETIARGILYIVGNGPRPTEPCALIAAVETALSIELPTLERLERVRSGRDKLARADVEATFACYLEEVRALVRGVDGL